VLLPDALSKFLCGIGFKDLHELFPLINQIASKFKSGAMSLLSDQLVSLFEATFTLMSNHVIDPDEVKIIRRDFFNFLNNICNCGLTQIFMSPSNQAHLPTVIDHLKNGAVGPDPVAAKSCFMVFTKLSKAWVNEFPEFGQVVQHTIIPSCFIGPSSPHVDLRDAQFQMAIVESANCMKELFNISGPGLVEYLRLDYMPGTLQIQSQIIDEYLQALTSKDIKAFRSYTKVFFGRRARV
jgi:exportin-T